MKIPSDVVVGEGDNTATITLTPIGWGELPYAYLVHPKDEMIMRRGVVECIGTVMESDDHYARVPTPEAPWKVTLYNGTESRSRQFPKLEAGLNVAKHFVGLGELVQA